MKSNYAIASALAAVIMILDQATKYLVQKHIMLYTAVDILPGDTPEVLQKRVMEQAEWKLLPKAVAMVCSGEIE